MPIGALSGGIQGGLANSAAGTGVNFQVGGLNTSTTFAGAIINGSGTAITGLQKVGTGVLTLTGTDTYTGPTTISGGSLTVDATTNTTNAALTATSSVTVASGVFKLFNTNASAATNMLNNNAAVYTTSSGTTIELDLNDNVEAIAALYVDGVAQPAGIYGSASYFSNINQSSVVLTSYQQQDEAYFTGDGAFSATLSGVPEPASSSLLIGPSLAILARRRRRRSHPATV